MKTESPPTSPTGAGAGGVARLIAIIAIAVLAGVAILVVLDVIPRSMLTEVASKTAMVGGICAVAALAIALLSRR